MQPGCSGGWRGAVGVALYTRPPGERGGREGSTRRSHLVTAPRKTLAPDPVLGRAVFRKGTRRDHSPPRGRQHPSAAATTTPGPAGGKGPTPTGGKQEDDARRMRPAPAAQRRQLTERRGARLLPGEHAPAAKDSSSVGGKACAPPPGFRARS